MPSLAVPTPTLKPVTDGVALLEKPLEVQCATATFPDGTAFDQNSLATPEAAAGFFIYRRRNASVTEIWNEENKLWEPDPGAALADFKPKPFIFKEGEALPWQTPVVAAGQKDSNDADQFQKSLFGFPQYFFRAFFSATQNGLTSSGLSGASQFVRFVSVIDVMRAGIRVGEDETPEDATEVTLFLRNAALTTIGSVEIKSESGTARVEISNRDAAGAQRAAIRLLPNGDAEIQAAGASRAVVRLLANGDAEIQTAGAQPASIRLRASGDTEIQAAGAQPAAIRLRANGDVEIQPVPGGNIIMNGSLDVGRIFYQPADIAGNPSGGKRWLFI